MKMIEEYCVQGGAFSNNSPIPESQYILKDIEYVGRVETKLDY